MEEKISEREPPNLLALRGLPPYGAPNFNPHPAHPSHPYNPYGHPHQQQQQQEHQQQQQQQAAQTPVCYNPGYAVQSALVQDAGSEYALQKNQLSRDCGIPVPASKPKIWSVADTVACKTPPPTAYLGQNFYPQHQQQEESPSHLHTEQQQSIVGQSQSVHPLQALQSSMTMGPQVELGSPLSMMSSYAAASPYSRIPTVYTEAMGMHIASAGPPVNTLKTPIHMHRELPQHQVLHSSTTSSSSTQAPYLPHHPSHQLQQQQQRVGFSEIQPDTPPQTPPNMKLISHNNSSSNNNSTLHSGPVPVPGSMLYSSSNNNIYAINGNISSSYLTSNRSSS